MYASLGVWVELLHVYTGRKMFASDSMVAVTAAQQLTLTQIHRHMTHCTMLINVLVRPHHLPLSHIN